MIEPRKKLLIHEFYLFKFLPASQSRSSQRTGEHYAYNVLLKIVLIELSDQLETTYIHGLALHGFDLDVIQSVLLYGIGENMKHSHMEHIFASREV